MIQEEKQLLLQDLCARLPYGIMVDRLGVPHKVLSIKTGSIEIDRGKYMPASYYLDEVKPYLRPMSSMTAEERKEFSKLLDRRCCEEDWEGHISISYCIEIDNVYTDDEDGIKYPTPFSMAAIDWLNARHFDYRGLIEKGLAIEAPEGMYYSV